MQGFGAEAERGKEIDIPGHVFDLIACHLPDICLLPAIPGLLFEFQSVS